jgi:hypothetical protein
MQRKEHTILAANFAWNSPPEGDPKMVLQVYMHDTGVMLTRVWMNPADARVLCQTGLEEIDKQLAEWQAHWKEKGHE